MLSKSTQKPEKARVALQMVTETAEMVGSSELKEAAELFRSLMFLSGKEGEGLKLLIERRIEQGSSMPSIQGLLTEEALEISIKMFHALEQKLEEEALKYLHNQSIFTEEIERLHTEIMSRDETIEHLRGKLSKGWTEAHGATETAVV